MPLRAPPSFTYTGSYYDVVKYAIDTHHLYGLFHLAVCELAADSPADLRRSLSQGAECCAWGDEQMALYESRWFRLLLTTAWK